MNTHSANPFVPTRVLQSELFASLPPQSSSLPVRGESGARNTLVVLDDDPTGTQTVHDVPVLTQWTVAALRAELEKGLPAFYLLTNSRSLSLVEAKRINMEIGRNLVEAARLAQRRFSVVSRSDSTLRGHFPGEVEALMRALGGTFDGCLLIPFFEAGGRYTVDDVQYVADGDWLVPVGETEFARDSVFGFRASNLRQWVEAKTEGRVRAEAVSSISLTDIRCGGPGRVSERLKILSHNGICVVNAASMQDLDIFTRGLLDAEAEGRRFLCRSAASFVPVRAGLSPRPLLLRDELQLPSGGGLVVVGSYVDKTTAQVAALLEGLELTRIEVDVGALLEPGRRADETARASRAVDESLRSGNDAIVFTSRRFVTGRDAAHQLAIGQNISKALVDIVEALSVRPRYLIAKGGITASELVTEALHEERALVQGQIAPGVPVWNLGEKSRFPGLVYVVFPGNVGASRTLLEIVTALKEDKVEL